jgi:hypothetical protein
MYGFKRLSHGMDKGGYYHEMFLQDCPLLAKKIQRQKIKGNGPRRPAQPDQEPNFYTMPTIPPEAMMSYQGGYMMNGCYPAAPPPPITLRTSLVLAANQLAANTNMAPTTSQPGPTVTAPPSEQSSVSEPLSVAPGSNEPRYDDEDDDALSQFASWF